MDRSHLWYPGRPPFTAWRQNIHGGVREDGWLDSEPRLSCDSYITFYCTNFLPSVTKYQMQYFSHAVSLSLSYTHIKISRWKITADQSKHKREANDCLMAELPWTKIKLESASLQFFSLSEEVNFTWPLVPCRQTKFFPTAEPRPSHSKFRSGRSKGVRWRSFGWRELMPLVKHHRYCLGTARRRCRQLCW